MLLDIGCGDRPFDDGREWTHMDERPLPHVEIVGDIAKLSEYVSRSSCEVILARHVLEHFSHAETREVLKEWFSCLEIGGTLQVEVPNLMWQAQEIVDPKGQYGDFDQQKIVEMIFGTQDYEGNYHKTAFTQDLLIDHLQDVGFENVTVQDVGQVLVAAAVRAFD